MSTVNPLTLEGETVTFVTDLHAGKLTYGSSGTYNLTADQHRICGEDMDMLSDMSTVVALGGDLIDWRGVTPEDAEFKTFLNNRRNREKYVVTSGNHDLAGFNSPYPWRTGQDWASAVGVPMFDTKPAIGQGVQVVTVSQDTMKFSEWLSPVRAAADDRPAVKPGRGFALSDAAFEYLEEMLKSGRPTWIMFHYPLREQYPSENLEPGTSTRMAALIGRHSNVIGVLSGHRHANPFREAAATRSHGVAGRLIASVNAAAAGGAMGAFGGKPIAYPWESPFIATVVTYRKGEVIIRWRDMIRKTWLTVADNVHTKTLQVDCVA